MVVKLFGPLHILTIFFAYGAPIRYLTLGQGGDILRKISDMQKGYKEIFSHNDKHNPMS